MLVLSRKRYTEIRIGPDITVKVLEIRKGQVKLGVEAPSGFSVWRGELPPISDRRERSVEHDRLVM
jgi:carbon storage regulator